MIYDVVRIRVQHSLLGVFVLEPASGPRKSGASGAGGWAVWRSSAIEGVFVGKNLLGFLVHCFKAMWRFGGWQMSCLSARFFGSSGRKVIRIQGRRVVGCWPFCPVAPSSIIRPHHKSACHP